MNGILTALLAVIKGLLGTDPALLRNLPTIILMVVDLYRQVRDTSLVVTDSALTDEQLAQLLQVDGLALRVEADHWLSEHGFGPSSPALDGTGHL